MGKFFLYNNENICSNKRLRQKKTITNDYLINIVVFTTPDMFKGKIAAIREIECIRSLNLKYETIITPFYIKPKEKCISFSTYCIFFYF
jgi:hypothetical protein